MIMTDDLPYTTIVQQLQRASEDDIRDLPGDKLDKLSEVLDWAIREADLADNASALAVLDSWDELVENELQRRLLEGG